jgi:hydroxypyruvate isomerase
MDLARDLLVPLDGQVGLQLDIYHLHKAHGDLIPTIRRLGPLIGHLQIADAPFRTEPGSGDIDPLAVLTAVAHAGYRGVVGLEYRPSCPDADLFGWMDAAGCVRA